MHHTEIRMVVTDLDGTLLSPGREISDKAVETIALLRRKNIHFTFITGRPPYAVERFAERVGITAPIACCNGAVIVQNGKLLLQHSFSLAPVLPLMELATAQGLTVLLYSQGIEYALAPTEWTRSREVMGRGFPLWHLSDHPNATAEKVNIMVTAEQEPIFTTLVPSVHTLKNSFSVAIYGQTGCEIVSHEVNKATGLRELCRLCGVTPEQTLAVGDNENDNPMLQAAGIGAAVANAVETTRALADYHCKLSYTDGVVEAICKFALMED